MKEKSPQAEQVARKQSAKTRLPTSDFRLPTGALWRPVTEKEKGQIRQDSKKLLNKFASKLSKIKAPEGHFENESGTREEGTGWKTDEEFRSTTFANAPFVEDNAIVAEKGAWKK